jgi:hypothetical protein
MRIIVIFRRARMAGLSLLLLAPLRTLPESTESSPCRSHAGYPCRLSRAPVNQLYLHKIQGLEH